MTSDPTLRWAEPPTGSFIYSDEAMGRMICEGYKVLAANMVIMGKVKDTARELGLTAETLDEVRTVTDRLLMESRRSRNLRRIGENFAAISPG